MFGTWHQHLEARPSAHAKYQRQSNFISTISWGEQLFEKSRIEESRNYEVKIQPLCLVTSKFTRTKLYFGCIIPSLQITVLSSILLCLLQTLEECASSY